MLLCFVITDYVSFFRSGIGKWHRIGICEEKPALFHYLHPDKPCTSIIEGEQIRSYFVEPHHKLLSLLCRCCSFGPAFTDQNIYPVAIITQSGYTCRSKGLGKSSSSVPVNTDRKRSVMVFDSLNILYIRYRIIVLSCHKIFQRKRIDRFVIRPSKHFIVQLKLWIVIDLRHEIVPFPRLICYRIYGQMQGMCRLTYMVPRKCSLSLWYGMYEASVLRSDRFSAFSAYQSLIPQHFQQILLRIWYIKVVTVLTLYYPLSLRRFLPKQSASGIGSGGSSGIDRIAMSQVCRHYLAYDRNKAVVNISFLVNNNLGTS